MTKARYMALEDFQTLWTDKLKPAIPSIAGTADHATDQECAAIVGQLI